jgi:hypothetical protein
MGKTSAATKIHKKSPDNALVGLRVVNTDTAALKKNDLASGSQRENLRVGRERTDEAVEIYPSSEGTSLHRINSAPQRMMPKQYQFELFTEISGKVDKVVQRWSGVVIAINDTCFEAYLEDLTSRDGVDEYVEIPIDNIEENQKPFLMVGATFFWHIGYEVGLRSPQRNFSRIRFRPQTRLTSSEKEMAINKAKEYEDFFTKNRSNPAGI